MWASPMDVVERNGDVHSRVLERGVRATVPSCILGDALMCASAIDVVERKAALAWTRPFGEDPASFA